MSYQVILTVWLLVGIPAGYYRKTKQPVVGISIKVLGMLACLYLGGFYD